MFSYEEKIKTVKLYLKYESWMVVINELEYPSTGALREWVEEYNRHDELHTTQTRTPKYSEAQIQDAINYYIEHGKNAAKTIRDLGYPNKNYLKKWLIDRVPDIKSSCRIGKPLIHLSKEQKQQAVIELCSRERIATSIA